MGSAFAHPFDEILIIFEVKFSVIAVDCCEPDIACIAGPVVEEAEIKIVLRRVDPDAIGKRAEYEREDRDGIVDAQRGPSRRVLDRYLVSVEPRKLRVLGGRQFYRRLGGQRKEPRQAR